MLSTFMPSSVTEHVQIPTRNYSPNAPSLYGRIKSSVSVSHSKRMRTSIWRKWATLVWVQNICCLQRISVRNYYDNVVLNVFTLDTYLEYSSSTTYHELGGRGEIIDHKIVFSSVLGLYNWLRVWYLFLLVSCRSGLAWALIPCKMPMEI